MLLCVAGGSGAEFRRDRPQAGSRCSSQSFVVKNNANQQVMVEERCSTASADYVAARATLSLHLRSNKTPEKSHTCSKESSVAYRSRVIVVSGDDAVFGSETCSTTTTFKSNVVNGKRDTNTILVRYKPSKPVSADSDEELRFEFCPKNDSVPSSAVSSSPPSTISSENCSAKEKTSISAWAQIMELEGYRSPAIGLDNCPAKHVSSVIESDSLSNFSSLSCESYTSEFSSADRTSKHLEGSCCCDNQINNFVEEGRFRKHNIVSIASKCDAGSLSSSRLTDLTQFSTDVSHSSNNELMKDFILDQDACNPVQTVSLKPKGPVQNRYSDVLSKNTSYTEFGSTVSHVNSPSKFKSPMFRSESSRVFKVSPIERNKNRRKTLPDGNLSLSPSNASSNNHNANGKDQKSPEHDPNASWGRYNSRAMRDSVRKVAEKYAETVYMKRFTRSQLGSLPECKGVQVTRFAAPLNETDPTHLSKQTLHLQNRLYHPKRASSTSHLHEIPHEKDPASRSRLHIIMPASIGHGHSNMTNDLKRSFLPYESKDSRLYSKLEDVISNEDDSICSDDDPKSIQVSHVQFENISNSCLDKDGILIKDIVPNDNISKERKTRSVFSYPKRYQTAHSTNIYPKNFSSIECKISSGEAKHPVHLSVHMEEIKSKLCSDCSQSAELGPPSKQSACRAKHEFSDACPRKGIMISNVSLLKRAPLVINDSEASPSLYLRPLPLEKDVDSKFENGPGKCTMLTAREMAELVHGKGNTDPKLSQIGVTSKVSSWIQKQKDKRKPMFFIGDTPSFFIENSSENNTAANSKTTNRKSRRSSSLSSVREGEVSKNCNGRAGIKLSANSEEIFLKPNEHKGLFIKRTSSSCCNRGSTRRKDRQGSPASEEREFIKVSNCHRNQVDGCVASWNNGNHNKTCSYKPLLSNNESDEKDTAQYLDFQQRKKFPESEVITPQLGGASFFRKNVDSSSPNKPLRAQREKYIHNSEILNLEIENNELICEDPLSSSFLENWGSRHSYSVVTARNAELSDLTRPERSAVSKKLLNFKQITRALSLHSLKKKTKELPMCSNTTTHLETPSVISFSKWTRGSKRKIESMKYGSLRKSISYCELTAKGAKVSGKLDCPINLFSNKKMSGHKPTFTPSKYSSCACAASLRRSVSLYWQFPLHKNQEYAVENPKNDLLAKICFSRLYRRNTMMPFLREIRSKRHTMPDAPENFNNSESRISRLDYKQPATQHNSLKTEKKIVSVLNKLDTPKSALNGDNEVQKESGIIMGLGRNHILNEIDNSSSLSVLEEYLPLDNSSINKLMNPVPVSMSKNKTPIVLRLQNKSTSRSERYAKGRSASEIWIKSEQKSSSDGSSNKKRPSSQFYDIEEFDLKSENESSLGQLSNVVSCSQPSLCAVDQVSNVPQSSASLESKHLPQHTSTPQLSPADSLLQRFRKSFAIRFKKKSETASSNTSCEGTTSVLKTLIEPSSNSKDSVDNPKKKSMPNAQNNSLALEKGPNICDKKTSPTNHRKELSLTYSNGRKRNKRKPDWRKSLFYDSVDSVFDTSFKTGVDKGRTPRVTGSEANIIRKRAASTSDYSSKPKAVEQSLSIVDPLTTENTDDVTVPEGNGKQDYSKTTPEAANSEDQQKNLTSLDQIWRANPVKLCRVHSRLLMCRHKGRYRLRRSISQPVELEMSGSIHNLRESTHGSADHDSFQKGSLSSEDEASSESDIYHSYCCSPTRRSNTCWELSGDGNMYAEALWDHETLDSEELPFQAGDIIEVTDTSDQDWWWGTKDGHGGWFPSAFVRLYVSHRGPSLHFNGQQSDGIQIPYSPCKVSMNNLSCEQVRANIVQEIVATERDYVKHLKDVVEGYLKQVHRRPDMFSKERIETVFGNIKEIYAFQSKFLKELEDCLDKDSPHLSQIGNCFLNHKEEFKIYSQYCNNHPLAVSELQELYCDSQYIHFFEACRLLQEMIDISLDGFLLTPIQRICKYPLQLAELLKFTDASHPDHVPVSNALAAMKEVAELVNERKRRMECLERIAEWQSTIEGWEGPDVLDTSSVLIHCGEVTRVSSSWSRDIYLFIFDHQLIYCKKDLLKRHTYAYKGRLNLDHCDILDVEDGKDSQFAVNVKNAWKIYCKDKEKWYLFYAKSYPEKEQWFRAFKAERQRVSEDEKQAFVVTEEAKRSARLAVHNKQKPKRPRAKFTKGRRCHPDVAVTELLLDSPNAKSRSGSLPSNIHPELAIMAGAKLGPTRKKGSGWFHFGSGKKPKS